MTFRINFIIVKLYQTIVYGGVSECSGRTADADVRRTAQSFTIYNNITYIKYTGGYRCASGKVSNQSNLSNAGESPGGTCIGRGLPAMFLG